MSCGGFCCERFRLRIFASSDESMSPEDLHRRAEEASVDDPNKFRQVDEMLIYLGQSDLNGNGQKDEKQSHWFTCRNFDITTRLCKIYESRPPICRRHGDDQKCDYDKCKLPKPEPTKGFPKVEAVHG